MADDNHDNLLAQHRLLLAVIRTDWATRLDHKVAATIIERYMRKQGNARASLRYMEKATGALRPGIIASTRRLLDHGVFHVLRPGEGTRPTEYGLNFQFSSSGIAGDTSSQNASSGIVEDTPSGIAHDTSNSPSGIAGDTQISLTGTGLQAGPTERENECGTATPPPPPPASAADGGVSPQGATTTTTLTGFDELWDAYDYKKGKPEARRAYARLAPDADLHAAMVKAARAWQTRWAEQNKPDAPRFTLAKWIEREEYECEPPTAYKAKERPKKGKQPAQPAASPDTPPLPLWARGKPSFWPVGSFLVKIVDSEVHRPEHTEEEHIILKFRIAGGDHHGEVHEHCICTQSAYVPSHAEEGKKTLAALIKIMGLETLKETEDMHDRVLRATANGTSIAYADVTDEEFDAFIPFDEAIERAALEAA